MTEEKNSDAAADVLVQMAREIQMARETDFLSLGMRWVEKGVRPGGSDTSCHVRPRRKPVYRWPSYWA